MQAEALSQADLNSLYLIVGTLVVMNLGAIGTGLVFVFKLIWRAAKYDSRIEKMERDINAAHQKLRDKHGE